MHRFRRTTAAAAVVLAAATACTSGGTPHPRPRPVGVRPNIVFVLTDDLATNLVAYMPHVQALMRSGATFPDYFVVDSLCCPSRAAIFTGQYPHDNGVFRNGGADGGYDAYNRLGNRRKSFAVALHNAGYRTAMMGKYLNGYHASDPRPPGWDEWDGIGNGYTGFDYYVNENGSVHHYGSSASDYVTDVLSHKAVGFIDDAHAAGTPFALEVATFAPHRPWVPAPRDVGTFPMLRAPRGPAFDRANTRAPTWLASASTLSDGDIRNIDATFRRRVEAVQAVDRMIGALQRELIRVHEAANTYFLFSSDNGLHMGEHDLLPGKSTAFDTDIRVPLVVTGPGIAPARTIPAFAASIDLAPTFLQLAGTRPTDTPDGVSLLPLLHGAPPPADWQRAVLIEHHGPVLTAADPDRQPRRAGQPPSYSAMRTPGWLYVEYATGEREYYDLARDPDELHSLAGSLSAARLAQLHSQLVALKQCHGATACQRAAVLRAPGG